MKNKPKNNQPKHLLVAEDEPSLSSSLRFILTASGYAVSMASNGREALATIQNSLLERTAVDLLITDIAMPTMNGVELIRSLRNRSIHIPVLVITGYGDKDLLIELMRLGCQDFLDKPFSQEELERRVQMILEKIGETILEQKRKETLSLIGERSRSFVHDLNNILAGTLGYADMALEKVNEAHPAHENLIKLLKTANRAADICRSLMAIKHDEPFRMKIKTEIRTLVEKIAAVLTELAPQSIIISTKTSKQPLWLHADAERIQQALLNLGINAIDSMGETGTLMFEMSIEELPVADENLQKCVCISVSDTGAGIPEAHIDTLFVKEFTTKPDGHGIGLPTIKKIVEEHSGRIEVRSSPKNGTRFKLIFPIRNRMRPITT